MVCPYLNRMKSVAGAPHCCATESAFEPSPFDLSDYCTSRLFRWCPLYRQTRAASLIRPPQRVLQKLPKGA